MIDDDPSGVVHHVIRIILFRTVKKLFDIRATATGQQYNTGDFQDFPEHSALPLK
jgi:hypothetical protein